MLKPLCTALIALCVSLTAASARADDYTIRIGTPRTGSSVPPNKVGLGIKVDVDKSWEQLSPQDQLAWREFTELTEPAITPPFPMPNIRGLLRKLTLPDHLSYSDGFAHVDRLFLVVHVSEKGSVDTVDIMKGGDENAKALNDDEKILAYQFITALQATKFSPAMLNGQAAPCAFPLHIASKTRL